MSTRKVARIVVSCNKRNLKSIFFHLEVYGEKCWYLKQKKIRLVSWKIKLKKILTHQGHSHSVKSQKKIHRK